MPMINKEFDIFGTQILMTIDNTKNILNMPNFKTKDFIS